MNCPFCNFQDIKRQKVYEDDLVYGILSNNPINKYHVLVIPKDHYESLVDLPNTISAHIITVVQKLSLAVRKASNSDAITHITEDEVTNKGYNMVKHFKFHIIPRYDKDMHLMDWKPLRVEISDELLKEIAEEIKSEI